jgi:hypothetical protein
MLNKMCQSTSVIIDNNELFPSAFVGLHMAYGDLTNNGQSDLVFTTEGASQAAVFQGSRLTWDDGILLQGPSVSSAAHLIVAPIRNDGENWLVYSEHQSGNGNEWLRGHRYNGTVLVENQNITSRLGWPGWMAPAVGDLDGDSDLEIWFISRHGTFPSPTFHLRRHAWDPDTLSYPGVEIKVSGGDGHLRRPLAGDFVGNGTQGLIWIANAAELELITYTPGSGSHDHTSALIFNPPAGINSIATGEFNGLPGADIAVSTWDGFNATVYLVEGSSFNVLEIASNVNEMLTVQMADLNGDGLDEIYAAGKSGGIYGYDNGIGWRLIAVDPAVGWHDGVRVAGSESEADVVLFGGTLGGSAFRVIGLSSDQSTGGMVFVPAASVLRGGIYNSYWISDWLACGYPESPSSDYRHTVGVRCVTPIMSPSAPPASRSRRR